MQRKKLTQSNHQLHIVLILNSELTNNNLFTYIMLTEIVSMALLHKIVIYTFQFI